MINIVQLPTSIVPGRSVYPSVLKALGIGHAFDEELKQQNRLNMIIIGSQQLHHQSVYPQVLQLLGFQLLNPHVKNHWPFDVNGKRQKMSVDVSQEQRQRYRVHSSKNKKVSLRTWIQRGGFTYQKDEDFSNNKDSGDEESENESSGDSFESTEDELHLHSRHINHKRAYRPSGVEIQKRSKYIGVFQASATDWQVYITPFNVLRHSNNTGTNICVNFHE